jgi:hypothetical protein
MAITQRPLAAGARRGRTRARSKCTDAPARRVSHRRAQAYRTRTNSRSSIPYAEQRREARSAARAPIELHDERRNSHRDNEITVRCTRENEGKCELAGRQGLEPPIHRSRADCPTIEPRPWSGSCAPSNLSTSRVCRAGPKAGPTKCVIRARCGFFDRCYSAAACFPVPAGTPPTRDARPV